MVRLLCVLCVLLSVNLRAESFHAPTPDWVVHRPLPAQGEIPLTQVQSGVHYRLLDFQIHAGIPVQDYSRYAIAILNQTGVEQESQINIDFDPGYQTLAIHNISVTRDGQTFDRLASADIKQLQRESELENLIHTGRTTVNVVLKDIRAGDVLEYSFTVTGRNPVHNNHFSTGQGLSWSVPVDALWFDLIWPRDYPLHYRTHNTDLQPTVTQEGKQQRYRLQLKNTPVIERRDDAPEWYMPWSGISFSEFQSWDGVVNWALPLYTTPAEPVTEIRQLADRIRLAHADPRDQIAEALRYAQGEIRYLGLELGQDSHKPASSGLTLERRFGDCKAKTIVFVEILKALGIPAYPALVHSETGYRLTEVQPSINVFDHVITWLEFEGKDYWLDPTRRPQPGSLTDIFNPQLGYALIIKPGQTELTAITAGDESNQVILEDFYELTESDEATLTIRSRYEGMEAERLRTSFESDSLTEIERDYRDYYAEWFGGAETLTAMKYTDAVHFETEEQYQLPHYWTREDTRRTSDLPAYYVQDYLTVPEQNGERTQPYQLAYPKQISQKIIARLPEDNWQFDGNTFELKNDFFEFHFSEAYRPDSNELTLQYHYRALTNQVPAHEFARYVADLEKIQDYIQYGLFQQPDAALGFADHWRPIDFVLAIGACYLLIFIFWLISRWIWPAPESAGFLPVSVFKFLFMSIMTFGAYNLYWFWANFRALKRIRQDASMPVARALFSIFWFYPLWKGLREDSEQHQQGEHLPADWIGALFALVYFLLLALASRPEFAFAFLVTPLLLLPMVNYIAHSQQTQPEALRYHSKFGVRQLALMLISTPLIALSLVAHTGLVPHEQVVSGESLWPQARKEIVRTGAMKADDELLWFYSDGFLSFREDGNGLTRRHVFSYWENEGQMAVESAEFGDIADIRVSRAEQWAENTSVTIVRQNGSEFVLFLSSLENSDKPFIRALEQRWEETKATGSAGGQ